MVDEVPYFEWRVTLTLLQAQPKQIFGENSAPYLPFPLNHPLVLDIHFTVY